MSGKVDWILFQFEWLDETFKAISFWIASWTTICTSRYFKFRRPIKSFTRSSIKSGFDEVVWSEREGNKISANNIWSEKDGNKIAGNNVLTEREGNIIGGNTIDQRGKATKLRAATFDRRGKATKARGALSKLGLQPPNKGGNDGLKLFCPLIAPSWCRSNVSTDLGVVTSLLF